MRYTYEQFLAMLVAAYEFYRKENPTMTKLAFLGEKLFGVLNDDEGLSREKVAVMSLICCAWISLPMEEKMSRNNPAIPGHLYDHCLYDMDFFNHADWGVSARLSWWGHIHHILSEPVLMLDGEFLNEVQFDDEEDGEFNSDDYWLVFITALVEFGSEEQKDWLETNTL